jgi:hypothetical protein
VGATLPESGRYTWCSLAVESNKCETTCWTALRRLKVIATSRAQYKSIGTRSVPKTNIPAVFTFFEDIDPNTPHNYRVRGCQKIGTAKQCSPTWKEVKYRG